MSTLSDEMKAEAVGLGLCQQWTSEWEDNSSKDVMAKKMIRGFDFCLKYNFPSLEVMKREDDGVLENNGIYCDRKDVDLDSPKRVILNGDSYADVFVMSKISEIDVRHTSHLKLKAVLGARVWVNLHDYATADIVCDSGAKVFVRKYGENKVDSTGGVKVKERKGFYTDKLYRR